MKKQLLGWALLFGIAGCALDGPPSAPDARARSTPRSTPSADVSPSTSSVVHAWLGLKNSDDVGTKFDLRVEMLQNSAVVATGQLNGVPGGSSGFNNAVLRDIAAAFDLGDAFDTGDTLGIRISVRIAAGVAGHRSGTARLWFGDNAANSGADVRLGATTLTYYLGTGFSLSPTAGVGPRTSIDVKVDRAVGGNPFKPFGTWRVVPPVPPRTIDVATTYAWRTAVTSTIEPALAQWSDGALLVASMHPAGAAYIVTASGGVATKTLFGHVGSRPSIWIPPQGETAPEIALSNYGVNRAQTRNNQIAWDNGDFGCCGAGNEGFPLDPATGVHWRLKGRARIDLRTGVMTNLTHGFEYHPVYIAPDYTYEVRWGHNTLARTDRVSGQDVIMPLPSGPFIPGAITAAQGYVHATAVSGGSLSHFNLSGQAWSIPLPGPSAPVITGGDLVVVASAAAGGNIVRAINLTDGSDAWSVPVAGTVSDIIVGDGGNLFVLLGAAHTMLALDASTGSLRKTYVNIPTSTEMILSNGTMYFVGPSELVAVTVESQGYDVNAPWPVRFGDNQRTTNLPRSRVR